MPLWLLRHAHTEWNGPPRRLQGRTDIGLSEQGRRAAAALGGHMARPDRIVASPARRCRETIEALFGPAVPPLAADARLWEIDLGRFSGLTEDEAAHHYPDEWRHWRTDAANARPGGGETLAEMQARVAAAIDDLDQAIDGESLVLVVTHGGPIRVFDCHLSARPLGDFHAMPIANLARYQVVRARTWRRLVSIG
ncbi:MAG: histidine phosphatase family protein [Alphaproteobacteria bacterium]